MVLVIYINIYANNIAISYAYLGILWTTYQYSMKADLIKFFLIKRHATMLLLNVNARIDR